MTKSPVSTCGVYSGRCLPRRILATSEAKRPRDWFEASTTNQRRSISFAFALLVMPIGELCRRKLSLAQGKGRSEERRVGKEGRRRGVVGRARRAALVRR